MPHAALDFGTKNRFPLGIAFDNIAAGAKRTGGHGIAMTAEKPLISVEWGDFHFRESVLREILDYWHKRRGARPMPARSDIEVTELPSLLPYIFIIDVLENPRDFRFRLAGTHFREAVGEEVTGKRLAEVFPPEFGAEVRQIWGSVVDDQRPVRGTGDLWVPGREYVKWEGVAMPLSTDGRTVNMLLGGVVFHQLARKKP